MFALQTLMIDIPVFNRIGRPHKYRILILKVYFDIFDFVFVFTFRGRARSPAGHWWERARAGLNCKNKNKIENNNKQNNFIAVKI